MRERELEKHKKEVKFESKEGDDELDLFNKLALKMTERLESIHPRETQSKGEESQLKDQILANDCPICFERLVPPDHSPYILFPCGHSFCESCLKVHAKSQKKCPFCRTRIESKALNIQLMNLIKSANEMEINDKNKKL